MIVEDFAFTFIDKYGLCIFFDKFGYLLYNDYAFLLTLKQKYPKQENKIRLWEILHGVVKPEITFNTTFQSTFSIQTPEAKSKLNIYNTMFISSPLPTPNRWKRFWYKKLLGWEWENLSKRKK